eukprot:12201771-Prorocentrum_lima.AAC.1
MTSQMTSRTGCRVAGKRQMQQSIVVSSTSGGTTRFGMDPETRERKFQRKLEKAVNDVTKLKK